MAILPARRRSHIAPRTVESISIFVVCLRPAGDERMQLNLDTLTIDPDHRRRVLSPAFAFVDLDRPPVCAEHAPVVIAGINDGNVLAPVDGSLDEDADSVVRHRDRLVWSDWNKAARYRVVFACLCCHAKGNESPAIRLHRNFVPRLCASVEAFAEDLVRAQAPVRLAV